MTQASKIFKYKTVLESIRIMNRGEDFIYRCKMLIATQDDIERAQPHEKSLIHRAHAAYRDGKDEQSQELYWRGKRNAQFPDRRATCYNCGKPGHIARVCSEERAQDATPHAKKVE